MKIALVTDAWQPQINGVVTTLVELVAHLRERGHTVEVIHPGLFQTRPCPGYAGIDLAVSPYAGVVQRLAAFSPQAIHIATEGPLGWAARRCCLRQKWPFTTAYHTRFPEILKAALRVPLCLGYALFRRFHRPSSGVMVPTHGVMRLLGGKGFNTLRAWTHGVDTELFAFSAQARNNDLLSGLKRPIALYVGRVSYEKNIAAFLDMPWHGSKGVCGVGPLEKELKSRNDGVRWLGVLPRDVLAGVYAGADVFTFPSRHETFGLVMLEAMATGTPVAAFPVDGPLEVLAASQDAPCQRKGGVLSEDLGQASLEALNIPRTEARQQALAFSWEESTRLFVQHLMPIQRKPAFHANRVSDPVFESYLRSTGRYADYLSVRDELIPGVFSQTDVVLSNNFNAHEPRLQVSWGASPSRMLWIGFPPLRGAFVIHDGGRVLAVQGLVELRQQLSAGQAQSQLDP